MNPMMRTRCMSQWLTVVVAFLCGSVVLPEPPPDLHQQLKDPSPTVRAKAALTLAEANDAEAIPVLIDLLAELPAAERRPIKEFLTKLAGEWAPVFQDNGDNKTARKDRRDAWRKWWGNLDGPKFVGIVRQHTPTPALRRKITKLLDQLGDDAFTTREAADEQLHRVGRAALPQLRQATASRDAEVARRAKMLIERIEHNPKNNLPAAVVRLLALRKPEGAAGALLAYLPFAEEENLDAEVHKALAALALDDGKLDAALLRGLADDRPIIRAAAAAALVRGGERRGRAAVEKLLQNDTPLVRSRIALAVVRTGDKDGVPVLIDLLTVLPVEQAGQAEETLYQLAGNSPPELPSGTEGDAQNKRRAAWAAWWKRNAKHVDMTRLRARPLLGFTLVSGNNRVYEIDRHGKERWSIDNLQLVTDAVVLPGNRVLIAEWVANRVSERDFKGRILWQKHVNAPVCVQRLANGHTFIASGGGTLSEVDRNGKEIYVIDKVPKGVRAAYRSRQGPIVYLTGTGACVLMDTTGKPLKSFDTHHVPNDYGTIALSPNGRILVTLQQGNKVIEYDTEGKKLREVNAPQPSTATALPNGRFLVASHRDHRVFEVDRRGKIVWEHKGAGHAYRARRR